MFDKNKVFKAMYGEKPKVFKGLWCSDQHTLHPNTHTKHILENLSKFYYKDTNLDEIKLVLWGGDFFHDLAQANDPNMILVQRWVKKFLAICHEKKIHVRILEGTSSHDWGQPEILDILKPKGSEYIKYVKELSIEFIPELNINMMYVPDNFGKISTEIIYDRAIDLLANNNLTQVDFIALHGGFKFQLPPIADKHGTLYDEHKWSKLAKHAIFSGHIHKPAQRLNIYCSGSFDRIAFGEMHPKGAYRFEFSDDYFSAEFYENTNAQVYDKLEVTPDIDTKGLVKRIESYLAKGPKPRTHIRIVGGKGAVVIPVVTEIRESYPQYIFDYENEKEDNIEIDETLYTPEAYNAININKDNLEDNLFRFMDIENSSHDWVDQDLLKELLAEVMNE